MRGERAGIKLRVLATIVVALFFTGCKEMVTTFPNGVNVAHNATNSLGLLPSNLLNCDPYSVSEMNANLDHGEMEVIEVDGKPLQGEIVRIPVVPTKVSFPDMGQMVSALVKQLPVGMYSSFRLVVTDDAVTFFLKNGDTEVVHLSEPGELPSGLKFIPANQVVEVLSEGSLNLDICMANSLHFDPVAFSPASVGFLASFQD
jgi:hypothetical protein